MTLHKKQIVHVLLRRNNCLKRITRIYHLFGCTQEEALQKKHLIRHSTILETEQAGRNKIHCVTTDWYSTIRTARKQTFSR